jgi:hypothetical protein
MFIDKKIKMKIQMQKTSLPYTLVPNEVLEDELLTTSEKSLYFLLLKHAGTNGACWPSQSLLAKELSLKSPRQVRNLIKVLVLRSLLKVVKKSTTFSTNNYIPLVTVYGKCTSPHTGNLFTPHRGNTVPTNNIHRKLNNEKKGGMSSISEIISERIQN